MREYHSLQSSILKALNRSEEVKKLDTWVNNDSEIVETIDYITPSSNGIPIAIPVGSLVKIIGVSDSYYIISYTSKENEVSGKIPKNVIKKITGIEWEEIKTLVGNVGWVLKDDIKGY